MGEKKLPLQPLRVSELLQKIRHADLSAVVLAQDKDGRWFSVETIETSKPERSFLDTTIYLSGKRYISRDVTTWSKEELQDIHDEIVAEAASRDPHDPD